VSPEVRGATGFWTTVGLMLRFARIRSQARTGRQRQLLGQRGATNWGAIGAFFFTLFAGGLHIAVAALLFGVIANSIQVGAEADGKMMVSRRFLEALDTVERGRREAVSAPRLGVDTEGALRLAFQYEARLEEREDRKARETRDAREAQLLAHYRRFGRAGFAGRKDAWGIARAPGLLSPLASVLGSLVVLAWFVMLAFQGEGIDLDLQRRRHPMWEWLLGHPVDARAVFLAEMLSPLAANPSFWLAPLFWIGAFWIAYDDFGTGLLAGSLAGLSLSVAAGCAGKAIEIVAMLRLPPRSRGAALGILSWLGQAAFMLMLFAVMSPSVLLAATRQVGQLTGDVSVPVLGWALGVHATPSPWKGVAVCWAAAAAIVAAAAQISAQATRHGLAGGFSSAPDTPAVLAGRHRSKFLRDPVYRKELLWLWRDRGALIQVFLVPLTMAALQVFNLRGVLVQATVSWHMMAGAAAVFGSYFLFILGPRSLLSEGSAIWIPLTWPRGLEDLLKAKAKLWWMASLVVVGPLLLFTMIRFPADAWKVAVVGLLWAAFGRSLAEKSVTLVRAPSTSGDPEPAPRGRQWAASLGTFTFAVGILSQQWQLAIVGVVFSWLTAAAMWQNFRTRLPYLFDPWSEPAPPAPTLMHAMVAVAAMTEVMAVVSTLLLLALGPDRLVLARSVAYGVCGVGAWQFTQLWLANRGVEARQIWRWSGVSPGARRLAMGSAIGLGLGLALGLAGAGFAVLVQQLPQWGPLVRSASEHLAGHPAERWWMALMAVGFAPMAEEYLFRGLLYRALDREWGGARAVWGSACFFAIYHPPLAWLPVVVVGAASALLFKRVGHLLPCVLLHATYNAVVVWAA
jgi:membrane protease YdiL (CAAX protease family)